MPKLCALYYLLIIALLSACAATPPPNDSVEQITRAELMLREAEEAGAVEHDPVNYRNAQKKLRKARDAIQAEQYQQADRLALEAEVDAQLAQTTAQTAEAEAAASELDNSIRSLDRESRKN